MHTKVDTFHWKVEIWALKLPQLIQKTIFKLKKAVFISESIFNLMFCSFTVDFQIIKTGGLQNSS